MIYNATTVEWGSDRIAERVHKIRYFSQTGERKLVSWQNTGFAKHLNNVTSWNTFLLVFIFGFVPQNSPFWLTRIVLHVSYVKFFALHNNNYNPVFRGKVSCNCRSGSSGRFGIRDYSVVWSVTRGILNDPKW